MCIRDSERFDENEPLELFDPKETWKRTIMEPGKYKIRPLHVNIFKDGRCVYESPSVMDIRRYRAEEIETIWEESRRILNPHEVHVDLSQELFDLKNELLMNRRNIQA